MLVLHSQLATAWLVVLLPWWIIENIILTLRILAIILILYLSIIIYLSTIITFLPRVLRPLVGQLSLLIILIKYLLEISLVHHSIILRPLTK